MELDVIEGRLVGGGDGKPMLGRHMVWALRRIREAFNTTDNRIDNLEAKVPIADARLDALEATVPIGDTRLDALEINAADVDDRLDVIEAIPALRITIVANLAALPATANTNQWFRVTGDPAVYVGNGTGQALRKITTAVL